MRSKRKKDSGEFCMCEKDFGMGIEFRNPVEITMNGSCVEE